MKCVTEYKKKVLELNKKYYPLLVKPKNANPKDFAEYLKSLAILDADLVQAIREERLVPVFSRLY